MLIYFVFREEKNLEIENQGTKRTIYPNMNYENDLKLSGCKKRPPLGNKHLGSQKVSKLLENVSIPEDNTIKRRVSNYKNQGSNIFKPNLDTKNIIRKKQINMSIPCIMKQE